MMSFDLDRGGAPGHRVGLKQAILEHEPALYRLGELEGVSFYFRLYLTIIIPRSNLLDFSIFIDIHPFGGFSEEQSAY